MKKTLIKILALTLAVLMLVPFVTSCSNNKDVIDADTNAPSGTDSNDTTSAVVAEPDKNLEMKIYALNGTTALGMAQMIDNVTNKKAGMNYNISLHASADAITGAIVQGECAIAALPTNVAVKLFNASKEKLQLLALNTLGVLYLLKNGEDITSMADLEGKTIYVPGAGSNPEYITAALVKASGVSNITINSSAYPSPDALTQAIAAGMVSLAVLPEPKVSVVTAQNQNVSVALNLTNEWETLNGKNTLVQGCLVVNTEFAKAHPVEVAKFLADYKASVEYIKAGSDDAINMIVNAKILPSAAVAKKALPNCNICYIAGNDMKAVMNTFCQKIFDYDKTSIGGALPTDGFYYVAN